MSLSGVQEVPNIARAITLHDLGWSPFFEDQRRPDEADLVPRRISSVHRTRLIGLAVEGPARLTLAAGTVTSAFAVGDWVLVDPRSDALARRLARRTVLERHVEGGAAPQLAAANVDTLFVVTSHNADFNPDRLERYLALANQGGIDPVIVLTKPDATADVTVRERASAALQRGLAVVTLDPRAEDAPGRLARWCGVGRTVAMVGSSGVGKSTLVNALVGQGPEPQQLTGAVRQSDDKGRHTTTARSLHAVATGGWVIDTPGMRTLNLGDAAFGIETLFAEIVELAPQCRFADCTHDHEPGCAIRAAVADGRLDAERVARWRRLSEENRGNTSVLTGPRGNRVAAARPRRR